MLAKVDHSKTLAGHGLDPADPSAISPVSFDVSLASYGAFWQYVATGITGVDSAPILERIAFDYKVFAGFAPDVYGNYIPFGFQSYYLGLVSWGDILVDFTRNNVESIYVTEHERQYIKILSVNGFRVRNAVSGTNVRYQLVVFR